MSTKPRKLLLIACSNRKKRDKGLMPALERYDGVNYLVIKKLMREGRFPENVDIKILSAKYGLLDAETLIPYYDQKMNIPRARELNTQLFNSFKELNPNRYKEIYVNMGKVYLDAIDGCISLPSTNAIFSRGGIGQRMAAMKAWLQSA